MGGWMVMDGVREGGAPARCGCPGLAPAGTEREQRAFMRASKPAQAHGTTLYSLQTIHSIQPAALKEEESLKAVQYVRFPSGPPPEY